MKKYLMILALLIVTFFAFSVASADGVKVWGNQNQGGGEIQAQGAYGPMIQTAATGTGQDSNAGGVSWGHGHNKAVQVQSQSIDLNQAQQQMKLGYGYLGSQYQSTSSSGSQFSVIKIGR